MHFSTTLCSSEPYCSRISCLTHSGTLSQCTTPRSNCPPFHQLQIPFRSVMRCFGVRKRRAREQKSKLILCRQYHYICQATYTDTHAYWLAAATHMYMCIAVDRSTTKSSQTLSIVLCSVPLQGGTQNLITQLTIHRQRGAMVSKKTTQGAKVAFVYLHPLYFSRVIHAHLDVDPLCGLMQMR
jgi:hypothetical protein